MVHTFAKTPCLERCLSIHTITQITSAVFGQLKHSELHLSISIYDSYVFIAYSHSASVSKPQKTGTLLSSGLYQLRISLPSSFNLTRLAGLAGLSKGGFCYKSMALHWNL